MNIFGKLAAGNGGTVLHEYDDNIKIRLQLGESIQDHIYYRGFYEEQVSAFVCREVRPGMDVLDVGANIGYFTMLMAKRLGEGDMLHAFEPDAGLFRLLAANVALNEMRGVVASQLAVSNQTGAVDFYPSPEAGNWGLGSLRNRGYASSACQVECIRLDDYFRSAFPDRMQRVGLIKMDIEGAELPALQGAPALLRHHPTLILEVCDQLSIGFQYSSADLVGWLNTRGYRCFVWKGGKLRPFNPPAERANTEIVCIGDRSRLADPSVVLEDPYDN